MCAQFTLKSEANALSKKWGIRIPQNFDSKNWDLRVRGFMKIDLAPVIYALNDKELSLKEMCYSLCPTWSAEFPFKWSTYNARMNRPSKDPKKVEYIYQVPTWREAFAKGLTCLIPMNSAIESSYFGSHAGNMIHFSTKTKNEFYVVGLYSPWIDKNTGEIHETFTLITDDPYKFFFDCGHDRSVFVINENSVDQWLKDRTMKPQERYQFLKKNRINLDWNVAIDRPLAKGWEKRKPTIEEINSISIWETQG